MKHISIQDQVDFCYEIPEKTHLSMTRRDEFEALATPCLNALYTTALRMTANQEDAENLVRDTLIEAYGNSDHDLKNTSFKTWVFVFLVKVYMMKYRKTAREPKKDRNDNAQEFYIFKEIESIQSTEITDKVDFLEKFHEHEIKRALEKLPDQYRLPILLCEVEEFSYDEITHIIDRPLRTVISQLYRGRKLLQRILWRYAITRGYILDEKE